MPKDYWETTDPGVPRWAILVALEASDWYQRFTTEESLDELERLAQTAGIQVGARVVQKRRSPHPGYFIGKGKSREVGDLCDEMGCDMVILDDELSPAQIRNLEDLLELDVWDRTALILDIFYRRASSKEAKLQVELARLQYLLPRLVGRGNELSRLAGGIGTRGRGEQKLEIDRRHIRQQISDTQEKLQEVKKQRQARRQNRRKHNLPVVSLVGYTNAGKSTLLTQLTGTQVTARDELFNTLDPKLSKLELPSNTPVLISDTVGFINKLPHHLVAAFHATLEEVEEADLILHVIDAATPRMEEEMEAVDEVLSSLETGDKPLVRVYNKMDKLEDPDPELYDNFPRAVPISALRGQGLDQLVRCIKHHLESSWVRTRFFIPYHREDLRAWLHETGEVLNVDYNESGMDIYARIPPHEKARLEKVLDRDE